MTLPKTRKNLVRDRELILVFASDLPVLYSPDKSMTTAVMTFSDVGMILRRLIVAPECAEHFLITDIIVSNMSRFANRCDGLPADIFWQAPKDVNGELQKPIKFDITVTPAQRISISVKNRDMARPRTFYATFVGEQTDRW